MSRGGGTTALVGDVGELTAVVAEIESRLAAMRDNDPGRRAVLRDRDRATLYLTVVRAGRAELIPEALYRGLLARNSPSPESIAVIRQRATRPGTADGRGGS